MGATSLDALPQVRAAAHVMSMSAIRMKKGCPRISRTLPPMADWCRTSRDIMHCSLNLDIAFHKEGLFRHGPWVNTSWRMVACRIPPTAAGWE